MYIWVYDIMYSFHTDAPVSGGGVPRHLGWRWVCHRHQRSGWQPLTNMIITDDDYWCASHLFHCVCASPLFSLSLCFAILGSGSLWWQHPTIFYHNYQYQYIHDNNRYSKFTILSISRQCWYMNEWMNIGLNPGPRARTVKPGPRHLRTRPDPGQNRLGPHKGIPSGLVYGML